jgi:hypothetical protein
MFRFAMWAALWTFASGALGAEEYPLAGKWINTDAKTTGIDRFEVFKAEGCWKIHAWAADSPSDFDQGETKLLLLGDETSCPGCAKPSSLGATAPLSVASKSLRTALGEPRMNYGFAHWDYKFKDTYFTIAFANDRLVVEDFNLFKDDSGRTNYRMRYAFKKEK